MLKIHMPSKRHTVIGSVTVLALLIIGFAVFFSYFAISGRALPHTYVGNLNVGNLAKAQISSALKNKTSDITVEFTGNGVNATKASFSDMGAELDTDASAKRAVSEHRSPWNYISSIFTSTHVEPVVKFADNSRVEAFAEKLTEGNEDATAPVAPKVEKQDDAFVVVPGVAGKGVSSDDIKAAAEKLAQEQKPISVKLKTIDLPAPEPDDALKDLAKAANDMVATEVTIHIAGSDITAEKADKLSWVTIKDEKPEIDREAVHKWVADKAAPSLSEGVTGVRYLNDQGGVLRVDTQAVAAKTAKNLDAVVTTIADQMATGTPTDATIDVETAAEQWTDRTIAAGAESLAYAAAPGEKWIDVNLTTFTAVGYEGTTAVRGPILISPGAPDTPTITGTFKIWHKTPSQTMTGTNTDGSRYSIDGVPWIMYFHGDYAIHGAPWRRVFGIPPGNGGSHGCVNVSPADAHTLYDWAPLGTVVVTHY